MVTMTSFAPMNLSTAHDDDGFVRSLLSDEPVGSVTFTAGLTTQSRLVDFKESIDL
jgi:hypothetical protein